MCLELSGGQGTLETVSQRGSQDLDEGGAYGEGEHWVDLGHTLHPASIGILIAIPAPGVLLPSMLGPLLSDSLCPTLGFQGNRECVFGVNNTGRLQGRKHQAVPWHPVICSSPRLVMEWRGLCPPPSPTGQEAGGCFS